MAESQAQVQEGGKQGSKGSDPRMLHLGKEG